MFRIAAIHADHPGIRPSNLARVSARFALSVDWATAGRSAQFLRRVGWAVMRHTQVHLTVRAEALFTVAADRDAGAHPRAWIRTERRAPRPHDTPRLRADRPGRPVRPPSSQRLWPVLVAGAAASGRPGAVVTRPNTHQLEPGMNAAEPADHETGL